MFVLLVSNNAVAQFYNGSQLTFGKNRVQYTSSFWTFYRFDKFDVYFYLNGSELAQYTAKYALEQIPLIEKQLDFTITDQIQFIVFNRLSDLKQSNIGLISEDQYNVGGITHIIGTKIFVYFNGDHRDFERQIRLGLANVVFNQLMFGEQIGANIKNSTLLTIPEWYSKGLISLMATEWNTDIDNIVKDGIMSGKYSKINRLTGTDATYAGHSFWRFLTDKYGRGLISNIVYMAKVSRSIESGFLYILGSSLKTLNKEWISYYQSIYEREGAYEELPAQYRLKTRQREYRFFANLKVSPNDDYAAYTLNELGQYKVFLYNIATGKTKKIMKSGQKLDEKPDLSYPLISWHPSGKLLAIIIESKSRILLNLYNLETKKIDVIDLHDFQKILDFSYAHHGRTFVMSAAKNGQSDIYVYNLASHTAEPITKDLYDDLHPRFIENSSKIIFSSNRVNDTIKFDKFVDTVETPKMKDLFLYNYNSKNNVLRRVTSTPLADETYPVEYSNGYISYLSDKNGIYNAYIARFDSAIAYIDTALHYRYFTEAYPVTNYSRNVVEHDAGISSHKTAKVVYANERYNLFIEDKLRPESLEEKTLTNTTYRKQSVREAQLAKQRKQAAITEKKEKQTKTKRFKTVQAGEEQKKQEQGAVDINDYEFGKVEKKDSLAGKPGETEPGFVVPKQRNYNVGFFINQLVNQIDFNFLNNSYQQFTGAATPIFNNAGINALFKVGVNDLLEDYRIIGGLRFSSNFDNTEYLLSYENLRKRVDKQVVLHRQSIRTVTDFFIVKQITHDAHYIVKYPFNEVLSIRGTATLRHDKAVFLSTDIITLSEPNQHRLLAGLKGELIFDNTRPRGLNIYYGTRYKLFGEYYQNVEEKGTDLFVVGADYRKYIRIHRTFIWANRFAASTSFGSTRLIYYLGGVDNWLVPKFNQDIAIDYTQNYAFQTIATNMRGFKQNIRNGNSFALINSELRLPVFRYFLNRPIKSELIENFQVVGFGDVGTAWTGPSPYSDENSLYTQVVQRGPIKVTVKSQVNPIVAGYGIGLRTRILGYFIRADWAWGVEDGIVQPDIFYISLSTDF